MQDHREAAGHALRRPDDQLLDEAAEWIGRLRAADVATADRQAFSRWLMRSPAHRAAFDTMADLWDGLGALPDSADASQAARPVAGSAPAPRSGTGLAVAAAAMAACLLVALVLIIAPWRDIHETGPGERLTVELEDGSEVLLNTATRIEVHYSGRHRSIELAPGGEAYFSVVADAGRPFVVTSAHGTARALGTRFAVHADEHRTLVSVTEGRVAVRARHAPGARAADPHEAGAGAGVEDGVKAEVRIDAGSQASVSAGAAPEPPIAFSDHVLEWRNGRLVYDDVPLVRLIDDLNRYLPKRMTIADPELASTRVSAVLRITDQDTMLDALSRVLPMKWLPVSEQLVIIHPA